MCGIFGFVNLGFNKVSENDFASIDWNRTRYSFFEDKVIPQLMEKASERGRDSFGMVVHGYDDNIEEIWEVTSDIAIRDKDRHPYFVGKDFSEIYSRLYRNDYFTSLISSKFIARAQPETEVSGSVQPILRKKDKDGIPWFHSSIVHNGAISESLRERCSDYEFQTQVDTEILLCLFDNLFLNHSNTEELDDDGTLSSDIVELLSSIDGGFAFHYSIFFQNGKAYDIIATKYHPLWIAETMDGKIVYHSSKDLRWFLEDNHIPIKSFYELKENSFLFIKRNLYREGINSCIITGEFIPYYRYPGYEETLQSKNQLKVSVYVSASGGIDSTTNTLLALEQLISFKKKNMLSDFKLTIVNFDYGHRGAEAEKKAVTYLYSYIVNKDKYKDYKMNIEFKLVNLKEIYKYFNMKKSQLLENNEVTTGTESDLKSTIAWVPVRNLLFSTILAGLCETDILERNYDYSFIVSGWNQLSEEGFYPDNSERFVESFQKILKFATLTGHRIMNWFITRNIMKYEQWALAKYFDFLDAYKFTISCDSPVYDPDTEMYYCCDSQCGSTILSRNAVARWENIEDPREFRYSSELGEIHNKYEDKNTKKLVYSKEIAKNIAKRIATIPIFNISELDLLGGQDDEEN